MSKPRAMIAIPLLIFNEMKSMCYSQERLLSNKTPRYFTYVLRSRYTIWLELLSIFVLYYLRSPIYVSFTKFDQFVIDDCFEFG